MKIGHLLGAVSDGLNIFNSLTQKRDVAELDQSGALKFGKILGAVSDGLNIVNTVLNQKREMEEFLARADDDEESGALKFKIGKILGAVNDGLGIVNGVKDALTSREDVDEESGALKFRIGTVLGAVNDGLNIVNGVLNNKREFEEILARDDEESGALKFGKIGKVLGHVNDALGIVNGVKDALTSRDLEEIVARAHFPDFKHPTHPVIGHIARDQYTSYVFFMLSTKYLTNYTFFLSSINDLD